MVQLQTKSQNRADTMHMVGWWVTHLVTEPTTVLRKFVFQNPIRQFSGSNVHLTSFYDEEEN